MSAALKCGALAGSTRRGVLADGQDCRSADVTADLARSGYGIPRSDRLIWAGPATAIPRLSVHY